MMIFIFVKNKLVLTRNHVYKFVCFEELAIEFIAILRNYKIHRVPDVRLNEYKQINQLAFY